MSDGVLVAIFFALFQGFTNHMVFLLELELQPFVSVIVLEFQSVHLLTAFALKLALEFESLLCTDLDLLLKFADTGAHAITLMLSDCCCGADARGAFALCG